MDAKQLADIEETHYLTEAEYFSQDGTRSVYVTVCAKCDEGATDAAALYPCETLQEALSEYADSLEINNAEKI